MSPSESDIPYNLVTDPFIDPSTWDNDEWMQYGDCRGLDPSFWFMAIDTRKGKRGGHRARKIQVVEAAKNICRECPVRSECLSLSILENHEEGIWGGLDENERSSLIRVNPRWIKCKKCNSYFWRTKGRKRWCEGCSTKKERTIDNPDRTD